MATIAKEMKEYYSFICPPNFQRKRTAQCENDALDMLDAYRSFNMITEEQYQIAEHEIHIAPHDDAISDIMCKLRLKIRW